MGPLQIIADYIHKARSKIYGIFAFWVILFGLPIIFTVLFVDQNVLYRATNKLKGEYIYSKFFDPSSPTEWLYVSSLLLGPFLMTFLMIAIFPKTMVRWSYKREIEEQTEREFTRLTEESKIEKKKKELAGEQLQTIAKEKEVAEEQEGLYSRETKLWEKEYDEFKHTKLFKDFYLIPEAIYQHYGHTSVEGFNNSIEFEVPHALLSYADSSGLIEVNVAEARIDNLTTKGKFFLTKYQLEM